MISQQVPFPYSPHISTTRELKLNLGSSLPNYWLLVLLARVLFVQRLLHGIELMAVALRVAQHALTQYDVVNHWFEI